MRVFINVHIYIHVYMYICTNFTDVLLVFCTHYLLYLLIAFIT